MEFQNNKLGKAMVVTVKGRMDGAQAPLLEAHCDQLIRQGESNLVLDFTELSYLCSAGLRALLRVSRKVQPAGGRVILCGLNRLTREIVDLAGFNQLFPICATLEEVAGLVL